MMPELLKVNFKPMDEIWRAIGSFCYFKLPLYQAVLKYYIQCTKLHKTMDSKVLAVEKATKDLYVFVVDHLHILK